MKYMKQRFRVPPLVVRKYKDDICFMVDTNFTYVEEVEPRMLYVETLGYEATEDEIEGYVKEIIKL